MFKLLHANDPQARIRNDAAVGARVKRSDTDPQAVSVQSTEEKIKLQLDMFVQSFINAFIKHLGAYYITAKGVRLTEEALKAELKTGATAALVGMVIARNLVGSLPTVAASVRTLSSPYYVSKGKAQKITRAFEKVASGELSHLLAVAAVEIFQSFESQLMQVTDKAGDKMAMEKLAEDAAGRVLNYIAEDATANTLITSELITKAIILGKSEKFFDPSLKRVRIRISGSSVQDSSGNPINTADLYEKTALVVVNTDGQLNKFYRISDRLDSSQYGYRRLLGWEKNEKGELSEAYKTSYELETFPKQETSYQYSLRRYEYFLQASAIEQESTRILDKIRGLSPPQAKQLVQAGTTKHPVLFNLKKPVNSFTGRTDALNELRRVLLSDSHTVVVTQAMSSANSGTAYSSGSQAAISGLGGIGKTQLALRYAELHAADYDHNVLWIASETKAELENSLTKLATKLNIAKKDGYGSDKEPEEIAAEIYAYFSAGKSLFIFDNVENYPEISALLPKSVTGNKPNVLITSRYRNWKNIATVVALDVFTEEETKTFIKKELNILGNTQDEKIEELNTLLQGLPLALQQAVAYIDNQRNINSQFKVNDYLELYKGKSKELLGFDFANYSNDPYSKTVFIVWQVTLDKIKQNQEVGEKALEILNVMAYLCPDNIANSLFLPLKNSEKLASAVHLLKSYSMINQGSQQDISTIHRLVQRVIRMTLEKDKTKLKEITQKVSDLTADYMKNREVGFHYLHFFLLTIERSESTAPFKLRTTAKKILNTLTYFDNEINMLMYCFDAAYAVLRKEDYLKFIGETLFVYKQQGQLHFVTNILGYMEKRYVEGTLAKTDMQNILDYRETRRLSPSSEIRVRQMGAEWLLNKFFEQLSSAQEPSVCSSRDRKKRSADSRCALLNREEVAIKKQVAYENIQQHLQTVSQTGRLVSTGIFTKDTFVALMQGNFSAVAINFGLLLSSTLLGKISNKLLVYGDLLTSADEVLLLGKDLALHHKLALSILTNEEVLSAGKRKFLGNTMKVASPFVARGASVFFAYNLIQQIKAYKAGNKELLHDITVNGILLGVDVLETGVAAAEYLELIEGVAVFTGPLGEIVVAAVLLESEIHHIKQQVAAIEKYVHLSREEEWIEDVRAFLFLAPSDYLEAKAHNNQRVKNAVAFLKKHTSIQRYIFAAEQPNSEVFFNKKLNLSVHASMPDVPSEGSLFCLSGHDLAKPPISRRDPWIHFESHPILLKRPIYLCKNAIGVKYSRNRTGNTTLIALDEGDDTAVVSSNFPSLFLVNNGKKNYSCGDAGCLFIVQGEHITGTLSGGRGVNLVNLESFNPESSNTLLIDEEGSVCGKNSSAEITEQNCDNGFKLANIQQIYGRKDKKDVIYLTEKVEYVDSYGGEKDHLDRIYITNKSNRNPKVVLRNNTVVNCIGTNATIETVDYKIPNDQSGETSVRLLFKESISHRFYFDFSLGDLNAMTVNDDKVTFNFLYQQRMFNVTLVDFFRDLRRFLNSTMDYPELPSNACYIFQDNTEIKLLNGNNIYAKQRSNKTIAEIVSDYPKIASRLNMMLSIQLMTNETVLIGHGKQVILHNNALLKSHLIGNGGENIYVVRPATNHTDAFPIPEVILYDLGEGDLDAQDTLDLRHIEQHAKKECSEQMISPRVAEQAQDLVLSLNAHYYPLAHNNCINLSNTWLLATVRLKNALADNWYQKLDIILQNVPMNIIFGNQTWHLEQLPLVFNRDKEIIVVTDKDIEKGSELFILKTAGQYAFFRNESDLFITNAQDPHATQHNLWTIMAKQAYQSAMREKVLSATLTFMDQQIVLKDYEERINNASRLDHLTRTYNVTLEPLPLPNRPSRTKRHADHYENYENMAYQYLERYDYHLNKQEKNYSSKKRNKKEQSSVKVAVSPELKTSQLSTKQNDRQPHLMQRPTQGAAQKARMYKKEVKQIAYQDSKNPIGNNNNAKFFHSHAKLFSMKPHHQAQRSLAHFSHSVKPLANTQADTNRKIAMPTPRLSYQKDGTHQSRMPLSHVTATPDLTGLLLFADVFMRKVTGKKYPRPFLAQTAAKHKKAERQIERINAKVFKTGLRLF